MNLQINPKSKDKDLAQKTEHFNLFPPEARERRGATRETRNRQTDRDTDIIECDLFPAPTQPCVHLYRQSWTLHKHPPPHTHTQREHLEGAPVDLA